MEDVAKHPWLFKRPEKDGTHRFYLRARVPKDLIEVFGKREIKKSLRTSDRAEARRLINIEAARLQLEFDTARRKLVRRPITDLNDSDILQIVRAYFQEAQREGIAHDRAEWAAGTLDKDKAEFTLNVDLTVLSNPEDERQQTSIRLVVDRLLNEQNLTYTRAEPEYAILREYVARAEIECVHRNRARLHGDFSSRSYDELFAVPSVANLVGPTPRVRSITLAELIERFESDPSRGDRQDKTLIDYAMLFRLLREVWGPGKPVREINREDCRKVHKVLAVLPANARKKFKGMTLMEAAQHAKQQGLAPMNPVTANGHLNKLSTLLRWAEMEEYMEKNPAKGFKIATPPSSKQEARNPFNIDQLNAIFQAPIYTGCVDDERNYRKPGANRPRRGRFWLPIISLFHGLRLNEAAQLFVADIDEQAGVDVILVREGEGQKLKTADARRFIPIHPEAIRIGFLDYVSDMKAAGEDWLFPELTVNRRGYRGDAFQKWFSRFMDSVGAKEPKANSFHSFRHTWRDALREANVPLERVNRLGGWAGDGGICDAHVGVHSTRY